MFLIVILRPSVAYYLALRIDQFLHDFFVLMIDFGTLSSLEVLMLMDNAVRLNETDRNTSARFFDFSLGRSIPI